MSKLALLESRIAEIAENVASDYPRIKDADSLEKLYAIEMTLYGFMGANADLHKFIMEIQKKFNISQQDISNLARDHIVKKS